MAVQIEGASETGREEKKGSELQYDHTFGEDDFTISLRGNKSALKSIAINKLTKFKYVLNAPSDKLKKGLVKRSLKGIQKLYQNALAQLDSHIKMETFFCTDGELGEECEGYLPVRKLSEDYEVPVKSNKSGSQGKNLYILISYTSDYDEVDKFLFTFVEVEEDDATRLRSMAREQQDETARLKQRVLFLEAQLKKKSGIVSHYEGQFAVLKKFLKKAKGERKSVREAKKKLEAIKEEFFFMPPKIKRELLIKSNAVTKLLSGKKIYSSTFEGCKELEDEWQDNIVEWIAEEKVEIDSFKLFYKGSKNGFSAKSFHQTCDGVKNCVTVVVTTDGHIFGSFNPTGWSKQPGYVNAKGSFIFSFKRPGESEPEKYSPTAKFMANGPYSNAAKGPTLGGGFDLALLEANNAIGTTNLGYTYQVPGLIGSQASRRLAGKNKFEIKELYVYGEDEVGF